jgi:hypothetical protein
MNASGDENNAIPSFLEHMCLHLAESLIGSHALIPMLEGSSSPTNIYWRTPLLARNDLRDDKATPKFQCVILDVTITLVRQYPPICRPVINAKFGTILVSSGSNPIYYYLKGAPLTMSDLEKHAKEIGVDMTSTAPKALAHSMGNALMGLTTLTPSEVNLEVVAKLPIVYSDVEETGTLVIPMEAMSVLDPTTASMLLQNFVQHDLLMAREEKVDRDCDLVVAAFEQWWTAALPTNRQVVTTKARSTLSKRPITTTDTCFLSTTIADAAVALAQQATHKPVPKVAKAGYSKAAKKRNRQGKSIYAIDAK